MTPIRTGCLPDAPLAAAAEFHAQVLPQVIASIGSPPWARESLVLVFPPADHTHRAWRLAAVQGLAREHAPVRINGLSSGDEAAIAVVLGYLAGAPGVTGQYWPLDATGAGSA